MGGRRSFHTAVLTILALIGLLAGQPSVVAAQTPVDFQDVPAVVEFGKKVTFQAFVDPQSTIQEAFISIQPQGIEPIILPVTVSAKNKISYQLDLTQTELRPFSRVTYFYRVLLDNGVSFSSPDYVFDYTDSRFTWEKVTHAPFEIYSYGHDLAFGELTQNTAQVGLDSIQNILPAQLDQTVRIYVYNTANDLKGALPGIQPWIAGQSAPDLGVILLSIPVGPEEKLELERQLPHELMHVMVYRLVGGKTANLPAWLVEGLASIAEIYPNPEYASALEKSAAEDKLIPIENLCISFPRDASGAFIAYAESASFMRYLHRTYGASAIRWLVEQYQNGMGCSEGIQTALGSSLTQLEYKWKEEELHLNPESLIFRNLLPYLLLFLVLFGAAALTIILSAQRISRPKQFNQE